MKISSMERELKLGAKMKTARQGLLPMLVILVIFTKARKMAREDSNGKMGHTMKETL
jgi:hypothetical protein